MTLEELKPGVFVRGILSDGIVEVISVEWYGDDALTLVYRAADGRVADELLYRADEGRLSIVEEQRPWSFDGDGATFRLVSEAQRIRLAYLFDPMLAVSISQIIPLPHQLTAVYEVMLPRQPLRFLLADDPGAGKTIMAGLLIRELIARSDVQRCLIVCPGNLVEQWQDELVQRFHLPFEILTNDKLQTARSGNWFLENDLAIARLDKLARDEHAQNLLNADECHWDLVIFDEAHKLSASFYGFEVKYTRRYNLGKMLSGRTRHLLLMTATPHNGKEAEFQLFLALLDPDRFEGKPRNGELDRQDVSDLMRRMVKEELRTFEGKPLFPERIAYACSYELSPEEARLYEAVTQYVREEWGRAETLGDNRRLGTVGFALTTLQRRLASSPEAIYQSLRRRRERLQKRLRELLQNHASTIQQQPWLGGPVLEEEDLDDLEDAPSEEVESVEAEILDQATAAATIQELEAEIKTLQRLENMAADLYRSGQDRKWNELAGLLNQLLAAPAFAEEAAEDPVPYGAGPIPPPKPSRQQKIVLFTEHRDTLNYLERRITNLLGRPEAVVTIHGALSREDRRKAQEAFLNDPSVQILLATDAAGEGINLQRAHLMVNYDLPWNPNRLEQRFGRIHRIGQTEVCHLWNLVAINTREGDVYHRLLNKIEEARKALGGKVFDVLGDLLFDGRPLRELLVEAIRYGDRPDVRARLEQAIEHSVNREGLLQLLEHEALAHNALDTSQIQRIRLDMERAQARRLQPHYIEAFFLEAFHQLGGTLQKREERRYEITWVPAAIRNNGQQRRPQQPIALRYERITFEKELVRTPNTPPAAFLCPGHPLLEAVIDLTLQRHQTLLQRGTILVDDSDPSTQPRAVFAVEHTLHNGLLNAYGQRKNLSKRIFYIEIDHTGQTRKLPYAPYLDFRPLHHDEPSPAQILQLHDCNWIGRHTEKKALQYAIQHLAPQHLEDVRQHQLDHIQKTRTAVLFRLRREIAYYDRRAEELKLDEQKGKTNARLNAQQARQRADELEQRLHRRLAELDQQAQITSAPPVVLGGFIVAPAGFIARITGKPNTNTPTDTQASAARARQIVMDIERQLGYLPTDREHEKLGYDIESICPNTAKIRLIEVKGRIANAQTLTVTKNEILTSLNKPDAYILAIVEFLPNQSHRVHYLRQPFQREPDFGVTSVNYNFAELIQRAQPPSCNGS